MPTPSKRSANSSQSDLAQTIPQPAARTAHNKPEPDSGGPGLWHATTATRNRLTELQPAKPSQRPDLVKRNSPVWQGHIPPSSRKILDTGAPTATPALPPGLTQTSQTGKTAENSTTDTTAVTAGVTHAKPTCATVCTATADEHHEHMTSHTTSHKRSLVLAAAAAAAAVFAAGCGTLQDAVEQTSEALQTTTCDVALHQYETAVNAIADNLDSPETAAAAAAQATAETSCAAALIEAVKQKLSSYDSDCTSPIGSVDTAKTAVTQQLRETERRAVETDKAITEADIHAAETSHRRLLEEISELQHTRDAVQDAYLVLANRSSCPDRDVAAWIFYEHDPWQKRTSNRAAAVDETSSRASALFAFLAGAPVDSTPDSTSGPATADADPERGVVQAGTVETLLNRLNALTVADEHHDGYDRALFPHWADDDGDGCDTRREVLIAEAAIPPTVGDGCRLNGGEWVSVYDGAVEQGTGRGFDVDHLVPLAEAWYSGAHSWNPETRQQFANDLGYEHSLVAVSATSNRTKSAGDPVDWLPTRQAAHCWYAEAWIAVKTTWQLAIDPVEKQALAGIIATCGNWTLGSPPG